MSRSIAVFFLAGCASPGSFDATAELDPFARVSCDPQMTVFPVGDAHNIGYDNASCGTGTCEISCPDHHANSDWGGAHHGIDVFAYHRAPLVAVADGEIVRVGTPSSTSGLRVRLRDACGWEYYYGHLDEAFVTEGQHVHAGDLIGAMGATGTGSTHLHFNVSPDGVYSSDINPFPLLEGTSATACGAAPEPPAESPPPPPAPGPAPAPGCGVALGDTVLAPYQSVLSCDGRFTLVMQGDGNLVLYMDDGQALWHASTHGNPGAWAVFQSDGNLVVYQGATPLWHAGTHGNPGAELHVQDDGNLVIYDASMAPLWHTWTFGH